MKMFSQFNKWTSVVSVIVFLCNSTLSLTNDYLPDIPCPNVFQYAYSGTKTIGIIKLNDFRHGRSRLVVELSQPGAYNLDYFGKLSLKLNKQKVFEYIDRGKALTFEVEFPIQNVVPKITSIEVNSIQICVGPKYGAPSTSIKLEYTLTTFPSGSALSKYDTNPGQHFRHPTFEQDPNLSANFPDTSSTSPSFSQQFSENHKSFLPDYFSEYPQAEDYGPKNHETSLSYSPTNRAIHEYINSICGQENLNFDVIQLNVKGTAIRRSRFPWISAIFIRVNANYTFQCGGSLISTRTVVSAAHCFYLGFEVIQPENILISLGLHALTDARLDANNIGVDRVIQHPDYNPTLINFDADLAVVRLKQSVTFKSSIRPICLWQGSLDNREIEGASGAIVGWGADNHRDTTIVPTLVKATIVSEITCIRSNHLFISLTSNRTLCAGNLDGSGPCMGDSGNGLMIKKSNKWMLRGAVSAALGTRTRQCLLDQYTIYSDIAKFTEWIHANMLL